MTRRLLIVIATLTLAACAPGGPTPPPTAAHQPARSTPPKTTVPASTSSAPSPGFVTIPEPVGLEGFAWAPDGQHLLINSNGLTLVDTSGKTVASPDG